MARARISSRRLWALDFRRWGLQRARLLKPEAQSLKPALIALVLAVLSASPLHAQTRYATGQDVVPAFEGWERNPDGSFNMVFGYMNRNYEEQVDVPIGRENMIEPGGPDQGQ